MFDKIKKLFTGDEEDLEVMDSAPVMQTEQVAIKDELEEQGLVNLKESQTGVKDFFQEPVVETKVEPVVAPTEEPKKISERKNTYRITEVISPIRGRKEGSQDIEVNVKSAPVKPKASLISELIRPISHNSNDNNKQEEVVEQPIVEPEVKSTIQSVSSSSVVLSTMINGEEDRIEQVEVNKFSVFTDDELAAIKTESLHEFEENFELFGHEVDVNEELLDDVLK